MQQQIGSIFNQIPQQQQTRSLFSFLPVMESMHNLLMRYGNYRKDLYPMELMQLAQKEINIWKQNETNMLALPEDVKMMIDQMAKNNIEPLIKNKD